MQTRNVAIICIWAFMIVLLIMSFVGRIDFLVVFFLFFIALIVTVYLASTSGEDNKIQKEFPKNMKIIIILLILILIISILYLTPIQKEENQALETQGARMDMSMGTALGLSENQTDIQKISWTVEIANGGKKMAEDTMAEVIFHPEVASRLKTFDGPTVQLGNLMPNTSREFIGNATFNSTGLTKQDIDNWGQLVKIKLTWKEDGKTLSKTIP